MNLNFYEKITNIIEETRIYKDEPMKKHTTFRVGGPADYFVLPKTIDEVKALVLLCQEENIPYFLLCGREDGKVQKPTSARREDKIYNWTWKNIKLLLAIVKTDPPVLLKYVSSPVQKTVMFLLTPASRLAIVIWALPPVTLEVFDTPSTVTVTLPVALSFK